MKHKKAAAAFVIMLMLVQISAFCNNTYKVYANNSDVKAIIEASESISQKEKEKYDKKANKAYDNIQNNSKRIMDELTEMPKYTSSDGDIVDFMDNITYKINRLYFRFRLFIYEIRIILAVLLTCIGLGSYLLFKKDKARMKRGIFFCVGSFVIFLVIVYAPAVLSFFS